MDEDGNSIDNDDVCDDDEDEIEEGSMGPADDLQRVDSFSQIMKQNVYNFLQDKDMSLDKNLAVSIMKDHFMALHDGVDNH